MFVLDTNACIKILNNASPLLVSRLKSHHPSQILLSSVVKAELLYGARKSERSAQNLRVLQEFFAPFRSLAFDDACSQQYAIIRAELEREGKPIGPYDMMIAATAIAHDRTLVTHNTDEFSRVSGLKWEDWEA
jgi:tRNA(fMet)-specific endonuclease VapC